jgi:hypothetical protein
MDTECILEIGVDSLGRVYVRPEASDFPYIYREAMDVHWDAALKILHSPIPRPHLDFNFPQWLHQILSAAKEQNSVLTITAGTNWVNVPDETKAEFLRSM